MKFILTHPVYLQGIRVKFVYQGQRVSDGQYFDSLTYTASL